MMCANSGARSVRATTRSGFTLLEIMIAIAIVAILGLLVGPGLMQKFAGAKKKTAKTQLRMLKGAIEMFQLDFGKAPERLVDLVRKPAPSQYYAEDELPEWQDGGYLKDTNTVPKDPWKKNFEYKLTPGGKHPYEMYSYGGPAGKSEPKSNWISAWDD